MSKKTTVDWLSIEAMYRANKQSVNSIAKEFGITEGTIRNRAKKHGWTRDPEGAKREIVKAAMAGITKGATSYEVRNIVEDEAALDIEDMQRVVRISRNCLRSLEAASLEVVDPKEIKVIGEANKLHMETIRRARGLDENLSVTDPVEAMRLLNGQA